MRSLPVWLGVAAGLLASTSAPSGAEPRYAPSHVLVRFKKPEARAAVAGLAPQAALSHLTVQLRLPAGARLREPAVSRWLRQHQGASAPGAETATVDLERFFYLDLPAGLAVEDCLRRLQQHPLLEYAELDGIGSGGGKIPNDPAFDLQWHHRNTAKPGADIHSTNAWGITSGSTNVTVAVLDTGLSLGLQEFAGRLVPGFDFANDDADPSDDHGHGTAVAGTLCASGNNASLIAGVDWKCRLMPVKVLTEGNVGLYSWWAQGIDFAVSNGAKVINLSAGGRGTSTTLIRAITNAIAAGAIFVTISHNDGTDAIRFPGTVRQAITVGATDRADRLTGFSNYGPELDLVAPGIDIYTVSVSGTVTAWWGTSFAAPLVAGVSSLLASLRPHLTQEEAVAFLTQGADDQVGDIDDTPGFDVYYGWGRLNAFRSLQLATLNEADLSLSLAASLQPVSAGCELVYTLTVSNWGPEHASGVLLTNRLPSEAALLSVTTTQGTFVQSGNALVFSLGQLLRNHQAAVTIAVSPHVVGILTNQASLAADQEDPSQNNNRASLTTLISSDTDGDCLPDVWENEHGLDANNPLDAALDADEDHYSNQEEYLMGTDPQDRSSYLRVDSIQGEPGWIRIQFLASSNRTYSVLFRDVITTGLWRKLVDLPPQTTNRVATILDPVATGAQRSYRLVTPSL